MKRLRKILFSLILMAFVSVSQVQAGYAAQQPKGKRIQTATLVVDGHCQNCKTKIEKITNELKGIKKAEWNMKTKVLTFTFNSRKTSVDAVKQTIEKAGYAVSKTDANKKECGGCEKGKSDSKAKDCGNKKEHHHKPAQPADAKTEASPQAK